MKKRLFAIVSITILVLTFTACGGDSKGEAAKIDKTVDSVAAELNIGNKQPKAYEIIGASDGAAFDDDFEIYLYDDTSSQDYKDITGDGIDLGIAVVKAVASNDGVILMYTGEGDADKEIVDKFNALTFN